MTRAMVSSRVGSRSLESPSLGNLHNGFGEGREGHTCSALGEPKLTANATRLAPTLHKSESLPYPELIDAWFRRFRHALILQSFTRSPPPFFGLLVRRRSYRIRF